MNVEYRLKQVEELDLFIQDKQNLLNGVLEKLEWKEELLENELKVPCTKMPGHWIPESALSRHQEICEYIQEGYLKEEFDKQVPDSSFFYEKSPDVVSILVDRVGGLNFPKTIDRWTVQLTPEERLAVYDNTVNIAKAASKPKNVTMEDLLIDFDKKEEQEEKPKSHLEILAEMRDYKRRRQSYRAKNVHITKKSYTEIMKEVIENQTSYLAETRKLKSEDSEKECETSHVQFHRKIETDDDDDDDNSTMSSNHKGMNSGHTDIKDDSRKHRHSKHESSKKKKHKRNRSRSKSPLRHKHKKSHHKRRRSYDSD